MSVDASVERRTEPENRNGDGNGVVAPSSTHRLRLNPNTDHEPDNYEDLQLEFSPLLFSSLEQYLPPFMLNARRDVKVQYMRDILLRYSNEAERNRQPSVGLDRSLVADTLRWWKRERKLKMKY